MSVASGRCALNIHSYSRETTGIVLAVIGTGLMMLSFLPRHFMHCRSLLSPKLANWLFLVGMLVMLIGMFLANVTPIVM